MKWFCVLMLFVFVGSADICPAQEGGTNPSIPAPPEDPPGDEGSLECQALDIQINDLDNEINRKLARKTQVEGYLAYALATQQEYLDQGLPVPPGVTLAIPIYRAWLEQLDADLRVLYDRMADLWLQYEIAEC